MKRSSAILKFLVVLGILTFGLVAGVPAQGLDIQRHHRVPPTPIMPPVPPSPPLQPILPPIPIPTPIPATRCTPLPAGLVGWWKGDGNAIDSAFGDNGTLINTTFTNGMVGQAFYLNGSNACVQIPDSARLKPASVTVQAWVRLDALESPVAAYPGLQYIVFKQNTRTGNFEGFNLEKNRINGQDVFRFEIASADGQQVAAASTTVPQVGVWYYLVGTYDSSTGDLRLYVNGVLEGDVYAGFPLDYGTLPVFIGTTGQGWDGRVLGAVDEVSIYNRALASNEIAAVYATGGNICPLSCLTPPSGLVGWWKGDGNTLDSVLGNNGVAQNITYTNGIVGQAFACDPNNYPYGTYTGIQIPDSPAYVLTNSLSIEGWVRPRGDGYNIFWRGDNRPGMDPYFIGMWGNNNIKFQICDQDGNTVTVGTTLTYNQWTHVAATLDGSTGTMSIYTNGVLADQTVTAVRPFGDLIPGDSPGVGIGNLNDGQNNFPFTGDIDEISLYNRALSAAEVQAIYNAGSGGKCTIAAPTCVSPPSGIVAWWPGEGNANDVVGGNNGTLEGGVIFAPGMVGQGFRLDGTNSYVQIPDAAALKPTNVTVEAWVWLDPNITTPRSEYIIFKRNSWTYLFEGYSLLKESRPNSDGTYTDRFSFVVTSSGDQVITYSTTAVQRGVWYHVAGTYDGNKLTLWVNGAAEASAIAGFALDYGTRPVFIGTSGEPEPYNGKLAGIIDEASIYNRALSAAEVRAIYNAGSAGKCPIAAPACASPPSGLIGWWPGEGNANDIVGGNNGVVQNITYTNGIVGQAFACDPENYPYGTYAGVQIPDQPDYVLTNALSIEGWIRPRGDGYCIFWRGDNRPGLDPYVLSMQGNNNLRFYIEDESGNYAFVGTNINYNQWYHVAATWDGGTGIMNLYVNGQLASQTNTTIRPFGSLIPGDSPGVGIGNVNDGQNNFPFIGDIDEISLYNRALTTAEIQSIYNAGTAGKCVGPFPPAITVQPFNQTPVEGSNVVLSVVASGTGPFSYQWSFNGTNISGATNALLTLTNLHPNQSGSYAVTITTPYGTITSSGAIVTVIARNILVYKYSGAEKITTAGQAFAYVYSGQMFFIPDSTNGTFVGWGTIKGKKQYWVNPLSDYLLITIPGASNQTFTVLGRAGQGIDTNGYPHIWSYLHKGKNTPLIIGQKMYFSFPNTFTADATHVYPDSQTGNMVLSESTSVYTFLPQSTQTANNTGQTMTDLVNALTKSLASQGYQTQ